MISLTLSAKYANPLPNPLVEKLARHLACEAVYIRDTSEYDTLPPEVRLAYREIAEEYARIVGVEAFPPVVN